MKERKGFVVKREGKLYVRIGYTDSLGKRRELMRKAQDRKHARELQKDLVRQLDSAQVEKKLKSEKVTFGEIASQYRDLKLIPAQYVGDRKVSGLRSLQSPLLWIQLLIDHFGKCRLHSITHSQIDQYRLKRLSEGLSIASTNRELELLRSVLNFAKREGLIDRTPFELGEPLIHKSDETRRTRIMDRDEEARLLECCVDKRSHLKAIIIALVDSGMRFGELKTLRWSDINLQERIISIKSFNCKTGQGRSVPISERLFYELQGLYKEFSNTGGGDGLIFRITTVKRSWRTACKEAKVDDLRIHDLRATFITRMIEGGMPAEEVSKISGHTQIQTLYAHYLRVTNGTIERAAGLLDKMNGSNGEGKGDSTD
jgi:integrase